MGKQWTPKLGSVCYAVIWDGQINKFIPYEFVFEDDDTQEDLEHYYSVYETDVDCYTECDELNARLAEPRYDYYAPPPMSIADDVILDWWYKMADSGAVLFKRVPAIGVRSWWGKGTLEEHWLPPQQREVRNA